MIYFNFLKNFKFNLINFKQILFFKQFSIKKRVWRKKRNVFKKFFFFNFFKKNDATQKIQNYFFTLFFLKNKQTFYKNLIKNTKMLKSNNISNFFLQTLFFEKKFKFYINGIFVKNNFFFFKNNDFVQKFFKKSFISQNKLNNFTAILKKKNFKIMGFFVHIFLNKVNYNWYSFSLYNWKKVI